MDYYSSGKVVREKCFIFGRGNLESATILDQSPPKNDHFFLDMQTRQFHPYISAEPRMLQTGECLPCTSGGMPVRGAGGHVPPYCSFPRASVRYSGWPACALAPGGGAGSGPPAAVVGGAARTGAAPRVYYSALRPQPPQLTGCIEWGRRCGARRGRRRRRGGRGRGRGRERPPGTPSPPCWRTGTARARAGRRP